MRCLSDIWWLSTSECKTNPTVGEHSSCVWECQVLWIIYMIGLYKRSHTLVTRVVAQSRVSDHEPVCLRNETSVHQNWDVRITYVYFALSHWCVCVGQWRQCTIFLAWVPTLCKSWESPRYRNHNHAGVLRLSAHTDLSDHKWSWWDPNLGSFCQMVTQTNLQSCH